MFAERMERLRVRLCRSHTKCRIRISFPLRTRTWIQFFRKTAVGVWRQNDSATRKGACCRWLCQCEKTFLAQVGDSFIVTGNGYEPLSEFAKDLEDVVC